MMQHIPYDTAVIPAEIKALKFVKLCHEIIWCCIILYLAPHLIQNVLYNLSEN